METKEQKRYRRALKRVSKVRARCSIKYGPATPPEITRLIHGFIMFRQASRSYESLHNSLLYRFFFVRNQDWLKNRRFLFVQCCKSPELMAQCLRAVRTYTPLSTSFNFIMRQLQGMGVGQDGKVAVAARRLYDIEKARLGKLIASKPPLSSLTDREILASFLNEEQLELSLKKFKISLQSTDEIPTQPVLTAAPAPVCSAPTDAASSKTKTAQSCSQAVPYPSPPEQFLSTPVSSQPVQPATIAGSSTKSNGPDVQPTICSMPLAATATAAAAPVAPAVEPARTTAVKVLNHQDVLKHIMAKCCDRTMSVAMITEALWPRSIYQVPPPSSLVKCAVNALVDSGDLFPVTLDGRSRVVCFSAKIPKKLLEDSALFYYYVRLCEYFARKKIRSFTIDKIMKLPYHGAGSIPDHSVVRSNLQALVALSLLRVENQPPKPETYYFT
ncbi:hypothetical protein PAPHI01_1132 [Pancytospora philotis]|nr:hypothetical protein PAPHI01_1132 [Pancytospora philotis]